MLTAPRDVADVSTHWHVEDVQRHTRWSPRKIHGDAAAGRLPHRRLPFSRRLIFIPNELLSWIDNPVELERIDLPGGGRIVRPKMGAR